MHPVIKVILVSCVTGGMYGCLLSGVSQSICVRVDQKNSQTHEEVASLFHEQGFVLLSGNRYIRNDSIVHGITLARGVDGSDCEQFSNPGCIYVFVNSYVSHNKIGISIWEGHNEPSSIEAIKALQMVARKITDMPGIENVSRIYGETEATVFAELCN